MTRKKKVVAKEDVRKLKKKMVKAVKEGKVELASTESVSQYERYIRRILSAIGYEEALVTDLSSISDFPLDEIDIEKIKRELDIDIHKDEYLVDIAIRLKSKEEH